MLLKNGIETSDPRTDRVPLYDETSRKYQMRAVLEDLKKRGIARRASWRPSKPGLDQGPDGACVGFSGASGLNASPRRAKPSWDALQAKALYWETQRKDPWEGGSYPGASSFYEGTALLTCMQVLLARGHISGFRWIGAGSQTPGDDLVDTLELYSGVQLGVPWFGSMFNTRPSGLLDVEPETPDGYHAIWTLCHRNAVIKGEGSKKIDHCVLQQTWGTWGVPWYGVPGHCFIRTEDIVNELLPKEVYGEGAVPVELDYGPAWAG